MVPENRAENGPENEPEIGLEVKKNFFSLESFFLFSLVKNTFRSSKLCIESILMVVLLIVPYYPSPPLT